MTKTFKTVVELEKYIQKAVNKAVNNASDRLLGTLQQYIDSDYYDLFEPEYYKRTNAFYNAAVSKVLDNNTAEIGLDDLYMSYQYPANYKLQDGSIGHWTGKDQAYMADAGFHGNSSIYRDGHFWSDFQEFCENNAINILKEELKKQGIQVK